MVPPESRLCIFTFDLVKWKLGHVKAQFLSSQNWNDENLCSEAIPNG